jgi:hypothetical protein
MPHEHEGRDQGNTSPSPWERPEQILPSWTFKGTNPAKTYVNAETCVNEGRESMSKIFLTNIFK